MYAPTTMDVSGRAFRMLFEAAEAQGITAARIAEVLRFDVAHLTDPRRRIDWDTFLAASERVADLLGRDPERVRQVGDAMLRVPSFAFMQRIARLLVSPVRLYELGNRWVMPTVMPETVRAKMRVLADGRLRIELDLPEHPRSGEWVLHIYAGNLRATPTLVGLPPAIVDARVGPRRIEAVVRLPAPHTLPERVRRSLRAVRRPGEVFELLDAQRREMEEAFTTSLATHRHFRGLLDNLPTLMLIHRDGAILWANHTLIEKLGWSHVEDLVGRHLLELIDPASRVEVSRRMRLAPGTPVDPLTQIRLLRRDGESITVEIAPTQDVDFGGPARLAVAVDVSERVALQRQLITADRIASIGLLGAGVAHEINNPLAYALAGVELATRQVSAWPGAPAELGELLGTVTEGLSRVRTIVRDLRMLARPDEGPPEPIDVRQVLESTLSLVASTLPPGSRIVREYGAVPPAAASGPRLGQVALNLLLNGIESLRQPGELRVRTLVDEVGRVAFEVEDTGDGISPDILARIFDPFFTTKPVGRGTGLGLAVSHQIVAGFGGAITVRTTPGRGSTFRVSLPAAEAPARPASPGAGDGRPRVASLRRRVLVVDDEPHLLRAIERMLPGHDVASLSSAAEALERLAAEPSFEVVLCDLMMAGMNGMQLYEELRRAHPELLTRIVFMTGGAFTNEARDFLARIPNRCIEKPFTVDQLEVELALAGSGPEGTERGG